MMEGLAYLREMNVASVLLRLTVAMLFGGFIGLERERKRRPAGFRTYMLVCLGAALTMLLSQYESYMVTHAWHETAMEIGLRTDVSRFGAQVINGIGFLGAGTIIVTGKQEVKGLGDIIARIKSQGGQIYEVDLDRGREERSKNPSAVFSIRLPGRHYHVRVLAAISELESVYTIDEI